MTVVMRFFKWVGQVWSQTTSWVLFWRCQGKPISGSSRRSVIKETEKISSEFEAVKPARTPKESIFSNLDDFPEVPEPGMLAPVAKAPSAVSRESRPRSLLQLSSSAMQSVSTIMLSAMRSGWKLCRWKSSMSTASVSCRLRSNSALETREAEMLREVYLVLWVIRKQLRELARRQERRRRRHLRSHTSSHASRHLDPVLALKQDARSPL